MITRCAGIPTGTGYLCSAGYSGITEELDKVVQRGAEILTALYGANVEIRFNTNRESGGAWVVDGKGNASIGLSASQYTKEAYERLEQEAADPSNVPPLREYLQHVVECQKDKIGKIMYFANIDTSIAKSDINGKKRFRWWDFETIEDAAEFLKLHCFGIPGFCEQHH